MKERVIFVDSSNDNVKNLDFDKNSLVFVRIRFK